MLITELRKCLESYCRCNWKAAPKYNNYVPVDAQDKQINMFPLMRKVIIPKLLYVLLLDD